MQDHKGGVVQLNWDDLKIVLAIGRAGSLTKAALLLGIDQSTAGRRLSAAEAALGVVLFLRSKTGFAPTEAGEEAIARALEIEARTLRLTEALADPQRGLSGPVRLVGNAWTLARLAATSLPDLLSRHPHLTVHAVAGPRPTALSRADATVSLWFESTPHDTEFAVKLGDVAYAPYTAAGTPPDTLDWVAFGDRDDAPGVVESWQGRLRTDGRPLRLTATDPAVLLAMIAAGVGKGFLPLCLANAHPGLVRVSGGTPGAVRTLYVHVHPDTVQNARVQATMAWLRESFEAAFGSGD